MYFHFVIFMLQRAGAKKFKEEVVIPGFTKLTKLLEQNNSGNGFFVGDDVSGDNFLLFNKIII